MKNPCVAFALLAFLSGDVAAQSVPALINYQGYLTTSTNTPIATADYELQISIFADKVGGTAIWGPQAFDGGSGPGHGLKVPVVQGWFNVMLGPVDTSSRSLADAFTAANRYVEVTVTGLGTIAPRQQILSAPFALMAEQAWTARSVQDRAITAAMIADGTIENRHIGVVSHLSAADGNPSEALAVSDAGNVSILSALPLAPLSVRTLPDSYTGNLLRLETSIEASAYNLTLRATNNAIASVLWALDQTNASVGYNNTVVLKAGNVGVGTTAPSQRLEVAGTVKATAFQGDGSALSGISLSALAAELANRLVPPGSIIAFGGPTPPPGWLLCDGTVVNRTGTYGGLFAAIGTAWGAGNGSTTFTLPDLRGMFLRGRDGGRGQDPDRGGRVAITGGANTGDKVGSYQADGLRTHSHTTTRRYVNVVSDGGGPWSGGGQPGGTGISNEVNPTGGAETRPRNVYVNYIIKY